MPKITCNDGAQLFFNIRGEGEPLVLIAGGFCDHHIWDDLIQPLSGAYQIITYDNRGIGQSDNKLENYSVALLAEDLNCLLTHLSISHAHIIGHSMGGFVAQYFAAFFPEKIKTLSLLSSLLMMNKAGHDYLDKFIGSIKVDYNNLSSMSEKNCLLQTMDSILQQAELCKQHDARSYINRIKAPTLIVSGLKEPVVTEKESQLLAASLLNIKEIVLLDCDHMLQKEAPNELSEKILDFCNHSFT